MRTLPSKYRASQSKQEIFDRTYGSSDNIDMKELSKFWSLIVHTVAWQVRSRHLNKATNIKSRNINEWQTRSQEKQKWLPEYTLL
jgi:2-succinyl-5-enolpyruvyl-6-hydroxy-3-cyclohexene-1-carboxylate synthase